MTKILDDNKSPVISTLRLMGFRTLGLSHPNKNGADLFVIKGTRAFSVEIKTAEPQRNSYRIRRVEAKRRNDDFIAIVFPSGYVLLEPMKQHLKLCSPSGQRTITGLC